MRKYAQNILVSMVAMLAVPAAQAAGNFFVSGQGGQIELSDMDFSDNSTDLQFLGLGYRWQAGSAVQVGFEVGGGNLGTLEETYSQSYYEGDSFERVTLDSSYLYAGANARFQFGAQSRWFAIARLGYMSYEEEVYYREEYRDRFDSYYDYSFSGGETDSGGGAYFSAGIGVDITPNINVTLNQSGYAYSPLFGDEYDYDDDLYTASSTSLGLEIRF